MSAFLPRTTSRSPPVQQRYPFPPPPKQQHQRILQPNATQRRSERREPTGSTTTSSQSSSSSSAQLAAPPVPDPPVSTNTNATSLLRRRVVQHIPPLEDEDDDASSTEKEIRHIASSSDPTATSSSSSNSQSTTPASSPAQEDNPAVLFSQSNDDDEEAQYCALSDMTPDPAAPPPSWIQLLQQLQHRHETERSKWKTTLQTAEEKKQQYKRELRQTIANQLQWLEDRVGNSSNNSQQKTNVLQELLALTDQQHAHDQHAWVEQEQQLRERIQLLETTAQAQQAQFTLMEQQSLALREELQAAHAESEERDALQEEIMTELEATREQLEQQQQSPSKQQRRVEWEDTLDRALAERDMFQQEAAALRQQIGQAVSPTTTLDDALADAADRHAQHTKEWQRRLWEAEAQAKLRRTALLTAHADAQAQWQETLEQLQTQLATVQAQGTTEREEWQAWKEQHELTTQQRIAVERETAEQKWKQKANDMTNEWTQRLEQAQQDAAVERRTVLEQHEREAAHARDTLQQQVDHWKETAAAANEERDRQCRTLLEQHGQEMRDTAERVEQLAQERDTLQQQVEHWKGTAAAANEERDRKCRTLLEQHGQEMRDTAERVEQLAQERDTLQQQVEHWKETAAAANEERDNKCRTLLEQHGQEMRDTATRVDQLAQERDTLQQDVDHWKETAEHQRTLLEQQRPVALQRLTDMAEQHTAEQRAWSDQLQAATHENTRLSTQVQQLSQVLADLKTLHTHTSRQYQEAVRDKELLEDELNVVKSAQEENQQQEQFGDGGTLDRISEEEEEDEGTTATTTSTELLLRTIGDLRSDVHRLEERLSNTAQTTDLTAYLDDFRNDLSNIQSSMNDAVAELTLEADAMLESREAIKTVASDASSSLAHKEEENANHRLAEQQETLLTQVMDLKDSLSQALLAGSSTSVENLTALRRAEVEVAVSRTELNHYREKLEAEIASRQRAEAEIGSMAEQADAYEEQLMSLQAMNDSLAQKLHIAGLKIDASLVHMPTGDDGCSTTATPKPDPAARSPGSGYDEGSLPVLDEALAMAENLTNIVNGDGDTKTSFLEMLESMSDMFDKQGEQQPSPANPPVRSPPCSPTGSIPGRRSFPFDDRVRPNRSSSMSPSKSHRRLYDENTGSIEIVPETDSKYVGATKESPPPPVETPEISTTPSPSVRTLQSVVEQLYVRCQLLERERAAMMNASVELLESSREASEAEIEAALATAKRRTSEDLMRLRRETFGSQERLIQKLLKQKRKGPE